MSAPTFSARRVWLVAHQTFGAAVHHRMLHFFVALALGLIVGARWLRDFNFGTDELKFLIDCGSGATGLFGAALVIVATAHLFGAEVENGTATLLLAKPLRRSEFIVGKFAALIALATLFCALMTLVVAVTVALRERELGRALADEAPGQSVEYASFGLIAFCQWLKLAVLAALTLLIATFARSQFLTVAGGAAVFAIGHLRGLPDNAALHAPTFLGRMFAGGVSAIFPNFQLFDPASFAVRVPTGSFRLGELVVYAGAYAAIACGLAVYSFRSRDL